MSILVWVIFGGLVGWIASIINDTHARQGILGNILMGVVGAMVGGFIANALGGAGITGFNFYSFLIAIGGALLFSWVLQTLSAK